MSKPILEHRAVLYLTVLLAAAAGCSDSTTPELGKGTVVIDQTPDVLAGVDWTLSGPQTRTGTGDLTLTDMTVGQYALTWGEAAGYITPTSPQQRLLPDGTITFTGDYSAVGTLVIEQSPSDLVGAGWSLTGPREETGSGNVTLSGVPGGEYTLTWTAVAGWIGPVESTRNVAAGQTVTFNGTYNPDPSLSEGFVSVPPEAVSMPVTFTMGSGEEIDETPHEVTLTHRILMAETEVTNGRYVEALQWAYDEGHVVMSDDYVLDNLDQSTAELLAIGWDGCEIEFSGGVFTTGFPDRPVARVTFPGAAAYCDWLSMQANLPRAYHHGLWRIVEGTAYEATGFRLPTEAEWEFACRAGTTTRFNTGACLDAATEANYNGEQPYPGCPAGPNLGRAADVGSYLPNAWGLFDMHGNLHEWCNDGYGSYDGAVTDPDRASYDTRRIVRGGWWGDFEGAENCRSAVRGNLFLNIDTGSVGFRPVRTVD